MDPDEVVARVKFPDQSCRDLMRPDLEMLKDTEQEYECPDYAMGKSVCPM